MRWLPLPRLFLPAALAASALSCGSCTPPATDAARPAAPQQQTAQPPPDSVAAALLAKQKHGGALYAHTCAVCHGARGEGYKADRAPALAQPNFLASADDAFLRNAIARGRNGSTMSAWAKQHGGPLSPDDIEAIVAFIRTWQKGGRLSLDNRPLRGDPKRAEPVYASECARCHGERGVKGPYEQIGNPDLLNDASNGFLRFAIWMGRPGTEMKPFAVKLGQQGLEDMVALVRSFGATAAAKKEAAAAAPPQLDAPLPLGKIPLNPHGPEPVGFEIYPKTTPGKVIHEQLARHARLVLLDARAPSDYVREHITGAVSVPFYDPSPYLARLPKNTWLVSYCACPHAESGELAQKLLDHGFKKVTVLAEGIGYWIAQDWKTTGTHPLERHKHPAASARTPPRNQAAR